MKTWIIAWKDIKNKFKDRYAIIMMFVAPIIIAAIMGAALGGLDKGELPELNIPITIINDDEGTFGGFVESAFESEDLSPLIEIVSPESAPTTLKNARGELEKGHINSVIHIPSDFSERIRDAFTTGEPEDAIVKFHLYNANQSTTHSKVIINITEQISDIFNSAALAGRVSIIQVLKKVKDNQAITTENIEDFLEKRIKETLPSTLLNTKIEIQKSIIGSNHSDYNSLSFYAPSMAIFFLMFVLFDGIRSILTEKEQHTLFRLQTTLVTPAQILFGKFGGVVVTGLLQFFLFVVISTIIFGIDWSSSLFALIIMAFCIIMAIAGLGAILIAFLPNANNANNIGTIIILVSSIIGGNFLPVDNFPDWMQNLSYLTINRWALDGLTEITIYQSGVTAILPNALTLLLASIVSFTVALTRLKATTFRV